MFFCLAAALLGMRFESLGQISVAARTILGVAAGASLNVDLLSQIPSLAASLSMIAALLALTALAGVPYFERVCGFDRITSYYSSMPGGLQDMIAFGQEAGGDARAISLIQATRVLVIVTILPVILSGWFGVSLSGPIGLAASETPPHELALMAAAALVGWKLFERLGVFGASILGPLVLAAALSLSGAIHFRPPSEAIAVAQFFIGMGLGIYYVGVTAREIRTDILAGIGFSAILAALTACMALFVIHSGFGPPVETLLSFAPGGQAEIAVLAIVVGADLGYVVIHHLARIFLVILGAPLAVRFLR